MADDLKPAVSLYETDFVAWTERQAEALRHGKTAGLDWSNLAEEIEDLGKSDQRACESLLEQMVLHLIKIEMALDRTPERHWRSEVRTFRRSFAKRLTPTIERRLRPTLEAIVERALGDLIEDGYVAEASTLPKGYDWAAVTTEGRFPPF